MAAARRAAACSAGKVDHKALVQWIGDQQTAAMWGSIYDEMYFGGLQVADGVENPRWTACHAVTPAILVTAVPYMAGGRWRQDPTMDWVAYTAAHGRMRDTISEWVDETVKEIIEPSRSASSRWAAARA